MTALAQDLERIKATVTVPMVLARRNVRLRPEGDHFRCACPLQNGHGRTAFIAWERRVAEPMLDGPLGALDRLLGKLADKQRMRRLD